MCRLLAVFAVVAMWSSASFAQQALTWYQMDFPPIYIHDGPYKEHSLQGIVDARIKTALEAKGYQVTFATANLERILNDLREKKFVCTGGLLRSPELERDFELTAVHSIAPPGGVVIKRSDLPKFAPYMDADGDISLHALLSKTDLKLGVASGRPYSGSIDEALAKYPDSKNLFYRKGSDITDGLMRMLISSRIDYTIMFPWEAIYIGKLQGEDAKLMSIPVQGMDDYIQASGACPKNDWGQAVVTIVDEAIKSFRNTPEYHQHKEYWLDDNAREHYRRSVQHFFANLPPGR